MYLRFLMVPLEESVKEHMYVVEVVTDHSSIELNSTIQSTLALTTTEKKKFMLEAYHN
jgi:hypothetical protein